MGLVQIKNNEVYCDSSMIAKKFGVKHAYVIRNCESLLCDIKKIKGDSGSPLIIKEDRSYRGSDFTAYLMGRELFSLLVMRFKGDKALEWQIKFNSAFYDMEKSLRHSMPIMDDLNKYTLKSKTDQEQASLAGSILAKYKKVAPENKALCDAAYKKVQLTLGFEE